jgi:transcriptional regulator NrdR family protein
MPITPEMLQRSRVIRTTENNFVVKRRRKDPVSGHLFSTYEIPEVTTDTWVVKREGTRERFNPNKLRMSVTEVCHKVLGTEMPKEEEVDQIMQIIANVNVGILQHLANTKGPLQTTTIRDLVLAELASDPTREDAFHRYLSCYEPQRREGSSV